MENNLNIRSLLQDLHRVTGGRVSLHDTAFEEIAAWPELSSPFCSAIQKCSEAKAKCMSEDKAAFQRVKSTGKAYLYTCHCGLTEMIAPVYHYGTLSGYFMLGQIADTKPDTMDTIKQRADAYLATDALTESIPKIPEEQQESFLRIFTIAAEYLTHNNAVRPSKEDLATGVKQYLLQHYRDHDLTVDKLCLRFECSRATLMNHFRDKYGVTIFAYLNRYRLQKAAEALKTSEKSIKVIAEECGFTDQNYFTKAFSIEYGVTPTAYRTKTIA